MEPRRRKVAQREGDREADQADDDDRSAASAQVPRELELEADLEHQEDQADLGQAGEDRTGGGRKQRVHEIRREGSEQAGPEQEAGEDLPRHVGLPESPYDRRHEPCRESPRSRVRCS